MEQEAKREGFFRRHKKLFIALIIVFISPIFVVLFFAKVAPLFGIHVMKPSIVRVTLPESVTEDSEPFDIYIGSTAIDGSGDYAKMTKVSNSVWERKNTFGEEEKDLDDWMVIKVRKSDQEIPSSVSSTAKIETRINGEEFQRGALLVDYWSQDWGDKDIEQTNSELKKSNMNWTFIAPPWDITSFDPVKIWNSGGEGMQYTEDQLRNHIKKLKADGIDVVMGPQLCCTKQPSDFADKSTAWWDEFFRQYENYLLFHARISEETGVKVFVMSFPIQSWPGTPGAPSDVEKRWEDLYKKVRSTYHGKVALFDYVCCGAYDEGIGGTSKFLDAKFEFFKEFDLYAVSLWNSISKTDTPTQEDLDKNMSKVLNEKVKYIYDKYKKPILLQTAYRSADGSGQATSKYSVDLIPAGWKDYVKVEVQKSGLFKSLGTIENKIPIMTYDGREQAMVYESIMKAVAERNWITGVYPFVYHMKGFDFPRHPDYDIRRKPAEKVLSEWYEAFKNTK